MFNLHLKIAENDIYCNSEQACAQSTLNATNTVHCVSNKACKGTNIVSNHVNSMGSFANYRSGISAAMIKGFGAYSLSQANIDSQGLQKITVKLYGYYSGIRAIIICRAGSICSLDCKHNGCKRTTYLCLNGSQCNIQPTGCNSDTLMYRGTDCPIWKTSFSFDDDKILLQKYIEIVTENQLLNIFNYEDETDTQQDIKLDSILSPYNKNNVQSMRGYNYNDTDLENGEKLCDTYQKCQNINIKANFTFCYAYESCRDSMIIGDDKSDSIIQCHGADSCQTATLNGVRGIECNAKWSCRDVNEISTQSIYTHAKVECNGYGSCVDIYKDSISDGMGIDSQYVECNGDNSCAGSTIHVTQSTECGGKMACYQSDIFSGIKPCTLLSVAVLILNFFLCFPNL